MTTTSREVILARVRGALNDVRTQTPEDEPVDWSYGQVHAMDDVIGRFIDRVEDYKAQVARCSSQEVGQAVIDALGAYDVRSVVVPCGLEHLAGPLTAAGVEVRTDDPPLSNADLDEIGAVVTASCVGMAETGTIVLDHAPDQGRRALSLVPDVHICLIREDQVASDVPEAMARPEMATAAAAGRPLTWISGGSATSDIELSRVEGVHGPRTLHVIVVA